MGLNREFFFTRSLKAIKKQVSFKKMFLCFHSYSLSYSLRELRKILKDIFEAMLQNIPENINDGKSTIHVLALVKDVRKLYSY